MATQTAQTPRGYRNNNPGNIRHNGGTPYLGEIPRTEATDENFKQFRNIVYGYRAIFVILNTYRVKYGLTTLRDWISRWAPPSDGNYTAGYITTVCKRAGIGADQPVDTENEKLMTAIVAAISFVENGIEPNATEIKIGYKLFKP
jgi:hypothetical protein